MRRFVRAFSLEELQAKTMQRASLLDGYTDYLHQRWTQGCTDAAALTKEINELGGDVTETADGLHIRPRPLHGGVFHTYEDHRMATAGAIIGLAVDGVRIENVATTAKTLPDFPELWTGMLGQ